MSTMTLKQVRDALRNPRGLDASGFDADDMADAIDAHLARFTPDWAGYRQGLEDGKAEALAQPAQAVDVGAIDGVIRELREVGNWNTRTQFSFPEDFNTWADNLTRALSGEKAGSVGDGVYPVAVTPKDAPPHSIDLLVYLPEHGWRRGFYTGFRAEIGRWPWSAESFAGLTNQTITHWAYFPASPTPDKEGV